MENQRDYQAIYFKDLIFCVLRRWKALLVAALIGGLLLGGVQWLNVKNAPAQEQPLSPEQQEQLAQAEQRVANATALLDAQAQYLSESLLMSLDPNQVYQASVSLFIHTDPQILPSDPNQEPSTIPAIMVAYEQLLRSGDLADHLSEQTGIQSRYLYELITCNTVSAFPGVVNVTIHAPDRDLAQQLLALIAEAAQAASPDVAALTAEHTLTIHTYAPVICANAAIADAQKAAAQRLTALQTDLQTQTAERDKLLAPPAAEAPASSVLMAVIGAFLGAFLVAAVACVAHMASSKVYSERTLKDRTGIRILGRVPAARYNPVDRWLNKLEGRETAQNAPLLVASSIRGLCPDGSQLLVIGAAPQKNRAVLLDALKDVQVSFLDCGDLLRDAEAFQALSNGTTVLLVEQCHFSTYSNINRIVAYLADRDKQLLGCVLLDG